ncbi:MAG: hypothetical protein AAF682_09990 [Planctomycetota bacterium]
MLRLAPLLVLVALAHAPRTAPLELERLAPDLQLSSWIERPAPGSAPPYASGDKPNERSDGSDSDRGGLTGYGGSPLIVHAFAWDDKKSTERVLPLMRDLLRANADRGLAVIGIADELLPDARPEDRLAAELNALSTHRVTYPVASADLGRSPSPYADGRNDAFVIGPNGALLWRGDPIAAQKDLLDALGRAYERPHVAVLRRPLDAKLARAESAYLAAELKDALAKAKKLLKSKNSEAAASARTVVNLVESTQWAWLEELRKHAAGGPDLRYFELAEALRSALPKGEAAKELEEIEKALKKEKLWRLRNQDLTKWIELRRERPALFPARKSKGGDAFAKELEKFLRTTANSNEATKEAKALLERYAGGR